ncbi:MAG: folate-binding protein [Gammaproteobacteria bacterium]|nr:MAG: folate-binding protein [Gammaproteobacteria bacterium]
MKPEWREFLINAGAEFDDGSVISFGNPEREQQVTSTGLVMCDLSHFGLISAYGEDAAKFLQGQLTNDIRNVSTQHSQLSAYCSPKGRMLSSFRIFKRDNTYYLQLPRTQLEATLKRLRMFILMAKVTMEDSSNAFVHIGVSGPSAEQHLLEHFSTLPQAVDDIVEEKGYSLIRAAGPHPRFEIYGELEAMKTLWSKLDVNAAPVGRGPWEWLDIKAGIPTIYPQNTEAFVPQMANMQLINGVNFQKGCYTGQEVVARMQYLGKLKRRMFQIHVDTDEPVQPGDNLFAPGSTSGQGTGNIVMAQPDPNGGYAALAVIDISDVEQGKIQLHDEQGPAVEVQELPYRFEQPKS